MAYFKTVFNCAEMSKTEFIVSRRNSALAKHHFFIVRYRCKMERTVQSHKVIVASISMMSFFLQNVFILLHSFCSRTGIFVNRAKHLGKNGLQL